MGAPWTAGERDAEQAELAEVMSGFAARGVGSSGIAAQAQRRVTERYRRRRIRARVFILLIIVVALSGVMTVFTTNRVPEAVSTATTAAAVPVALYLGLRDS